CLSGASEANPAKPLCLWRRPLVRVVVLHYMALYNVKSFQYTGPMASVQPIRAARRETVELHTRAMDNLRFIRETMERAGAFTAVPGGGGFAMGVSALLATAIAARQRSVDAWLAVWLIEGAFAIALGGFAMRRKAASADVELFSTPARKFAFSFAPPLLVG